MPNKLNIWVQHKDFAVVQVGYLNAGHKRGRDAEVEKCLRQQGPKRFSCPALYNLSLFVQMKVACPGNRAETCSYR